MALKKSRSALSIVIAVATVLVSIAAVHQLAVPHETKLVLDALVTILGLIVEVTYLLLERIHDLERNVNLRIDTDPRLVDYWPTIVKLVRSGSGVEFAMRLWILKQLNEDLAAGYHKKLFDPFRGYMEDVRIGLLTTILTYAQEQVMVCANIDAVHIDFFWKRREAIEKYLKSHYNALDRGVLITRIFIVSDRLSREDARYFVDVVIPALPSHKRMRHYWMRQSDAQRAFDEASSRGRKLRIPARGFFIADKKFLSEGQKQDCLPHLTFDVLTNHNHDGEITSAIEQFDTLMNCPAKMLMNENGVRQLRQFLGVEDRVA